MLGKTFFFKEYSPKWWFFHGENKPRQNHSKQIQVEHRPSDKVVFVAFVPLEELEGPPGDHFVGGTLNWKETKNASEKRWPQPKWLFPQTEIWIIVQLIIGIFRTKFAVSFRDSVGKVEVLKENPCRQRGDFMWWLFSCFLSCLTFVKVFVKNYQHLFLSDCLPPRFSKSIILNEWVWISTWMSQEMSRWFVSGLL